MIPAAKKRWFLALFAAYVRRKLRGTFEAIRVEGAEELRRVSAAEPLVVVANHTSWWDPMVLIWLDSYVVGQDGFAMMEARNLRKFPFFRHLGVFGVDRGAGGGGQASLDYARGLLDGPGRSVWLFPQGAERPVTEPLAFFEGAARVGAQGFRVVPMGIRYEFGRTERPTVWISFGEALPVEPDPAKGAMAQQEAVAAALERIEAEIRRSTRGEARWPALLEGSRSVLGVWAERVLSGVAGLWR